MSIVNSSRNAILLIRSDYDPNMFHIAYQWRDQKRIAFTIHIDDIEGVFGENIYNIAINLKPGNSEFI